MATRLMTSVITRYQPRAGFKKLSHPAFSNLMQTIIDASTALDAAVPAGAQPWAPTPATDALQAYKDSFDTALAAWNPSGPRGSRSESEALKTSRKTAEQGYQAYMDYVASWSEYNPDYILAAGLQLKALRSPSGAVGTPTDLRQVFVRHTIEGTVNVASPYIGLHFKRAPNAKSYNIYRILGDGRTLVMSTTKARFNKVNVAATPGTQVVLRVEAVGAEGSGSLSDPFTLTAI